MKKVSKKQAVTLVGPESSFDIIRLKDGSIGWIEYKNKQQIVHEKSEIEVSGNTYEHQLEEPDGSFVLANGPGSKKSPSELIDNLKQHFRKSFYLADEDELNYLAIYALATWNFDQWKNFGYVALVGPPGAGKSLIHQIHSDHCYNCVRAMGTDSESSFIRTLALSRGTLAIGECQRDMDNSGGKFHQMLAEGISITGAHRMSVKDKSGDWKPKPFLIGGPKTLSGRSIGSDEAILSRIHTINVPIVNEINMDKYNTYCESKDYDSAAAEIRNDLLLYRQRRAVGEINAPSTSYNELDEWKQLTNRERQANRWLLEECPTLEEAKSILKVLQKAHLSKKKERALRLDSQVLLAALELFQKNSSVYLSEIAAKVSTWDGVNYTPRRIGTILRELNVPLERGTSGKTKLGITKAALEKLMKDLGLDTLG